MRPTTLFVGGLLAIAGFGTASAHGAPAGHIEAWGNNGQGQCDVPPGEDFIAVAAGDWHTVALRENGALVSWGRDDYGQVGDTPTGGGFLKIAAGQWHSLALKPDGSLVGWGRNEADSCIPPSGYTFAAMAAGGAHSLGVADAGEVVAWGEDRYGQVSQAPPGNDFTAVSAGDGYSLALRSDGTAVAWGDNTNGQCDVPVRSDFTAISAGGWHGVGLMDDGELTAWGRNTKGECDLPGGDDYVAIDAGAFHTVALREDGSLAAWGDNTYGQCDVASGTDFAAVGAGLAHGVALTPEPATLALLALGGLGVLLGRRKTRLGSAFLLAITVVALLPTGVRAAYPETRTYQLGDVDNFVYEGPGSQDDVYVDPDWMAYVETVDPPDPEKGFDLLSVPWADPPYRDENHNIPFTFVFPLGEGESVIGASLALAVRATDYLVSSDGIFLDGPKPDNWHPIEDLGWLPIEETGTSLRGLDLSNVLGKDYLPSLQDEEFNVLWRDDVGMDYAVLTVTVVPEPATLAMVAIGGVGVLVRRRRSHR